MSKATINVREEDKRAYIKMPECEFHDTINVRDTYVYDATRGIFDLVADIFRSNDRFDFNDITRIINQKLPEHIEDIKEKMELAKKSEGKCPRSSRKSDSGIRLCMSNFF
ncbi:MAG: hypothetical protein IJQ58_10450 [Synergistaceae bacterium]|nr:hypothetical protein [Synergistaceae bacterium]